MNTRLLLFVAILLPFTLFAQSSEDYWNWKFNPRGAEQQQKQRILDWYKSWSGRQCQPVDVKKYWRLTLLTPMPGSMDSQFNEIGRRNAQINSAIETGLWDYDAQDTADQLNIFVFRATGKETEAIALEQLRVQRQAARQQQLQQDRAFAAQLFQGAIFSAQLKKLNDQLWLLRQEIRR